MFLRDNNKIMAANAYVILSLMHKILKCFTYIISFNLLSVHVKQYNYPHFTEEEADPKRG